MKTLPVIGIILSAGFLRLAGAPATPAVPALPPVGPDVLAKPYVLFMRTDVAVEQNRKLYPIKDVSGRMFIISVKGQPMGVPMTGGSHKLEFKHALTLARNSASLTGFSSERVYTPGRDPRMKRQRDAVLAEAVIGDNASLSEGKYISGLNNGYTAVNSEFTAGQRGEDSSANLAAIGAANAGAAFQAQSQMQNMRQSNITSGGFARLEAESDLAQEMFDAVEVRFGVSSPVYLEKPYVVVITQFRAKDDKPGMARNAVLAKALESIGANPTKVEVLQGGFPPGFEIENLQVHLYSEGHEIPTDIAQKRVPLTRDEAFEYLKIEYVSAHKNETVSAEPALGLPDKEGRLRLSPAQWQAVYYAKVSKDGLPIGTYLDEACNEPVDDTISALTQNVRYYPAMEKGKAMDGVARLVLSQLEL